MEINININIKDKEYLKECINSILNKFDKYDTKREELCKKLEQREDATRKGGKK